jgi:hypothetical protein
MSKGPVVLLLIGRPFFDFNQTAIVPFNFLQDLLCLRFLFAVRALMGKSRSFDVLGSCGLTIPLIMNQTAKVGITATHV